jgi:hypothetical protein
MPIKTFTISLGLSLLLASLLLVSGLGQSVYASTNDQGLSHREAHCGKGKHKPVKPYHSVSDEEEGTPDPEATFPTD